MYCFKKSLNFLKKSGVKSWQAFIKSPEYYAWRGNAFEIVCLNHIPQIKEALGISGVESSEYSWRSKVKEGGAQIDLLIDRRDDVINLCKITLITSNGVKQNENIEIVQNIVEPDKLFR